MGKSMNRIRSTMKYMSSYFLSYPIYIRCEFNEPLPALPDIRPLEVKNMDLYDDLHIKEWLSITNQAFGTNYEKIDYEKMIVKNASLEILNTFFLIDGNEHIGVVSEACFTANKEIGVTHMLAIKPKYRGKELGKYMILYALHQIKKDGLKCCEMQTLLKYNKSINIHFDFGFVPKRKVDSWNTKNNAFFITKIIVGAILKKRYKKWRKKNARKTT